ncbi:cell surface A33 antigen-like isoform X2 [Astyanax mexicanus]|uniref:Cell surface A33 antigen-like isoform X2 n=1 Tax=Astyanax mexicanus TaxID=7994 RepID=A0A8T2MFP6_ASTMX|nr:cell surface A33 antigen-like isoform X2 [Astyanax mexicanus]
MCVSTGCTLVNRFETFFTTAHAGESVLLPCSCTDLHSTPDTFSWKKHNTTSDTWEEISSESDQYRNRVQLFNNLSPANLSLLISHLTEEDAGYYLCYLAEHEYTSVKLTVAGCTLENNQGRRELTARSGESVLLPCFCTTLHFTPETFSWKKLTNTWTVISSESDQYRNRVQLFNNLSPANLSLLISHLTEEDDGGYRCNVKHGEFTDIRLTVTVAPVKPSPTSVRRINHISDEPPTIISSQKDPPQSLPFVPFALVTVIFLHIIVAAVYCTKRTKVSDPAAVHYSSAAEDGAVNLQ